MTDNRNTILAIVLSVVILIGFQFAFDTFYPKPPVPQQTGQQQAGQQGPTGSTATPPVAPAPDAPAGEARPPQVTQPAPGAGPGATPGVAVPAAPSAAAARAKVLAETPRVRIETPRLHGSIALTGGRLDDLTLATYRETNDPQSPEIVVFSPAGTLDAYFAQSGWIGVGDVGRLPDPTSRWTADGDVLAPGRPVTLSWSNEAGLTFRRTFSVDEHYLFTITERVENQSGAAITLSPYALISRYGTPTTSGFFILHEGPLGVFNGTLKELDYEDLSSKGTIQEKSRGGWIGITDKYWLAAIAPAGDAQVNARFLHEQPQQRDRYQIDVVAPAVAVAPGESAENQIRIFAGAKEVRLLDQYMEQQGIERFDRAIDFGWFYFLTKPLFLFLIFIKEHVGNLGVAILLLTVLIKALFFPLANKSYKAMSQMRKLQPELARLKERFGDDRARFNQEMMALYKKEKINPASGCLPIIIQIPVFFALYKVLFVTIEMRHAPFFGWIQDLSAPDPTSVWNLFGLIPWDPATLVPSILNIGAWPLIMGVSMWLQQKLNPQPPDPIQAKMFMLLPIVFTFMLAQFPAGLVIYWAWNNVLSIAQQWVIMRRAGVKI